MLHTAAPSGRDNRVDVLRGLALVSIFINHVPGNAFEHLTHKNFGFSDAAEVFVLLAGYAAAMAWYPGFTGNRMGETVRRIWARAGFLYVCHLATTLAAITLFASSAVLTGWPGYLLDAVPGLYLNLATVIALPGPAAIGIVTGGHQLGYFNILPLYICLLLMLPALMLLARLGIAWLLAASFSLWLAAALFGIDLPDYPRIGGWFFNPLSWQLLFSIGLALGIARRQGITLRPNRTVMALATAWLVFAAVVVLTDSVQNWPVLPLPWRLYHLDKTYVALPRLMHVLALGYVVMMSPIGRWLGMISRDNPLAAMGRNSLGVFCCGSLAAMTAAIIRSEWAGGLVLDVLLVATGLALQVALGRHLDRRRKRPVAAMPAAVAA